MKPNSALEHAFRTHLVGAAGYYHHLLFKLQQEHQVPLDGIVDMHLFAEPKSRTQFSFSSPESLKRNDAALCLNIWQNIAASSLILVLNDVLIVDKKQHSSKGKCSDDVAEWAKKATHRCLVYLGDIGKAFFPHFRVNPALDEEGRKQRKVVTSR